MKKIDEILISGSDEKTPSSLSAETEKILQIVRSAGGQGGDCRVPHLHPTTAPLTHKGIEHDPSTVKRPIGS